MNILDGIGVSKIKLSGNFHFEVN